MSVYETITNFLSFGAPIAAASATYALFSFLDKKASAAANRAIVAWIKGDNYIRLDLRAAVTSAFDNLYGTPLLRLGALLRSAGLSTISLIIYALLTQVETLLRYGIVGVFIVFAPSIIVSDYLSLFIIRRCLSIGKTRLVNAMLLACGCAVLAIVVATELASISLERVDSALSETSMEVTVERVFDAIPAMFRSVVPALFVHLWLPLFLPAGMINGGLNTFLRAAGVAQWFIKRGDIYPMEALGFTASAVVFIGAVVYQGAGYFMFR